MIKKHCRVSNKFGFMELIGSIVLLLVDPERNNFRRYLQPKYYKLNRYVGIITVLTMLIILLIVSFTYFSI